MGLLQRGIGFMVPCCHMLMLHSFFLQGEKNNGFDVLYHNMKYGYLAAKDLAEFFRER